jgi:pyridine nucleotide-disulfide oxidoreductase family protein
VKRLVLVGAGHAHVEVLRRFGERRPGAVVTLVTRAAGAIYSGMLPGAVAGHYAPEELTFPVPRLAARAGAELRVAEAAGLDPEARLLRLADGGVVAYDLVSLDIGATPDRAGAADVGGRLIPVKPLDRLLPALEAAEARLRPGAAVAVVGGGVAGAELALALRHRWRDRDLRLALVERGPEIVPGMPAPARRALLDACARHGVEVRTGASGGDGADLVVWATGAAAPSWVAASGLAVDESGFAAVGPDLRSLSHAEVFAAGDIAAMPAAPRPKAGVFAVRQGPVLAGNLSRALAGEPLARYRPQRHWLAIVTTGPRHAVATRNGLAVSGAWVWRWKDRIDRRFVARYQG